MRWLMARFAFGGGVATLELVSGLRMIEFLYGGFPVDQIEVFAVVLGMTFSATPTRPV